MRAFQSLGGWTRCLLCVSTKDPGRVCPTRFLFCWEASAGVNLETSRSPLLRDRAQLKEISDIPIFHERPARHAVVTNGGYDEPLKVVARISTISALSTAARALRVAIIKASSQWNFRTYQLRPQGALIYKGAEGLNESKAEIAR